MDSDQKVKAAKNKSRRQRVGVAVVMFVLLAIVTAVVVRSYLGKPNMPLVNIDYLPDPTIIVDRTTMPDWKTPYPSLKTTIFKQDYPTPREPDTTVYGR